MISVEAGLFDNFLPLAQRIAQKYTRKVPGWSSYDDLLQECKIALLRSAKHFQPELGFSFPSYATAVISRAAREYISRESRQGFSGIGKSLQSETLRASSRRVDFNIFCELATYNQPGNDGFDREEWSLIFQCLPALEKQVFFLRLFGDLSNREISEKMGFGTSRVSFLWQSAIARIKTNSIDFTRLC